MEAATSQAIFSARQSSKPRVAALAAILLVAATLRSINLGAKSIWLDEAYRIYLARMGWHDFLQAVKHPFGANSVAYHLVLRYWLVLGGSEAAIRSLSVVFGIAIVLAIYKLGAELFDSQTGLIAAALAASNALLIRYSQEVCAYTPATLLAVISSLYLWRALRENRRRDWVGYVIAATLMVYCHVLSIFVVVAQGGAVLFARRGKLSARTITSMAIVGAAFVPPAWCITFGLPRPHVWTAAPGSRDLLHFVTALGGPDGLLLSGLLLLFGALSLWYREGKFGLEDHRWRYSLLLMWALAPPLLLFLLSQWKPLFIARYLLPSVPAVLLLAAAGLRSVNGKRLAAICVVALLIASVYNSALYLRHRADHEHSDDWRDATAYLARSTRAGDTVVFFYPHERFPFQYYLARFAPAGIAAHVFPSGTDENVLETDFRPSESNAWAAATGPHVQRVWLVTEYAANAQLVNFRQELTERLQNSPKKHFGFIQIDLFTAPKAGQSQATPH